MAYIPNDAKYVLNYFYLNPNTQEYNKNDQINKLAVTSNFKNADYSNTCYHC